MTSLIQTNNDYKQNAVNSLLFVILPLRHDEEILGILPLGQSFSLIIVLSEMLLIHCKLEQLH